MKPTIYIIIILGVAGAIAYMVYDERKRKAFVPTGNFAADDQRLYNMMRADLQSYEAEHSNGDTLTWFDDMVAEIYPTSLIAGQPSKALAYLNTLKKTNGQHPKLWWFGQLIDNLKKRYQ